MYKNFSIKLYLNKPSWGMAELVDWAWETDDWKAINIIKTPNIFNLRNDHIAPNCFLPICKLNYY